MLGICGENIILAKYVDNPTNIDVECVLKLPKYIRAVYILLYFILTFKVSSYSEAGLGR